MSHITDHEHAGEYDFEPVPGLPEELPDGETLIWQGAPTWRAVALHVLHVRKLAIYFAVMLTLRLVWLAGEGRLQFGELSGTANLALAALFALGLLLFLARLIAKTTLYTITSRRVVMRIGVALPMTLNLPFIKLKSADLRVNSDGTGDIIMQLGRNERLSYVVLWPHLKMRRVLNAKPALRSLADPVTAARHFSQAIAASSQDVALADTPIDTDRAMVA